jgi:hypothetical protein
MQQTRQDCNIKNQTSRSQTIEGNLIAEGLQKVLINLLMRLMRLTPLKERLFAIIVEKKDILLLIVKLPKKIESSKPTQHRRNKAMK